jgi:NAD(P) transhydrogenase
VDSNFDFVVIGSGPAGEKAAALAAYHGKSVAVIERAPRPGGTMIDGVASTKTMREAAIYLTSFRQRQVYGTGLRIEPELAVQGVRDRTARVESLLARAVASNLAHHGIELIHGTARLAGPGRVEVQPPGGGAARVVTAPVVLLATGSRPFHPPGVPFEHRDVLDSDSARQIDRPLRSVVVIGGGAVACEFASIFCALGCEVTLIENGPQLLPFVDGQIAQALAAEFRDMGMQVLLDTGRARVTADDDGPVVTLPEGPVLYPTKVVLAVGRTGNTESLGLEEIGVAVDGRGHVVVDDRHATTVPGIWAAGDVTGPPALASVAMAQGRIAARHALGIPLLDTVDQVAPLGVYSIPEVAMVGLTEDAARANGEDVEVGQARLSRNARTAITGDPHGLVKLVFRRGDRRLLGAHILGGSASELIHQAQAVMLFGGTIDFFINATFNSPTASEAFKYAAYDGLSRLENRPTLTTNV